jgi:hypothetical protein
MADSDAEVRSRPEAPMSEYTARANIKNFKAQLLTSSDEVQKATLRNLLREEMQLLTELVADRH